MMRLSTDAVGAGAENRADSSSVGSCHPIFLGKTHVASQGGSYDDARNLLP
jgi:hypothetical protein